MAKYRWSTQGSPYELRKLSGWVTKYPPPRHQDQTTRSTKTSTTRRYQRPSHHPLDFPPLSDHLTEGTIFELSLYGCKPSPESDSSFFCVGKQRLNYWPCLPVNKMSQKIQKHGAETACMAHTATCQTKKNNKYLTNLWYNCHNQSFVHVFSHRTFLCALQFRSFHLKSFFFNYGIFSLYLYSLSRSQLRLNCIEMWAQSSEPCASFGSLACQFWKYFVINASKDQGRAV